MTITTKSDVYNPEILTDAVQGRFARQNAFMGSLLASTGAVVINGEMPIQGAPANAVGTTITVPYFGTVGEFATNNDGSSVTPSKISQASETATIVRKSLAFELSKWSQGQVALGGGDFYNEGADQVMASAERAMDDLIMTAAVTTPLVNDKYSATVPHYITWDDAVDTQIKFADEQDEVVAMAVHSRTLADIAKLKDGNGNSQLVTAFVQGLGQVRMFNGLPLVISDKLPLTSSAMGTVSSTGTSPPVCTLGGTPTGPWNLVIDAITGDGTTLTFRFSTDGGNTWSVSTLTAADDGVAVALTDTAVDSLVGNNGTTGVTAAFAAGTFNADNQWTSTALLKARSLIIKRGSLAFWYARALMALETDKDILAHTDIAAMHLYGVGHLYRRHPRGTKPGVAMLTHNLRSYVG